MSRSNTVFIGKKPSMSYVVACMTLFTSSNEVVVKARGRAISKAVDVVEIIRNRFMPDVKVSDIKIGTEEVKSEGAEEPPTNVSTIEIRLTR
ncbi:DNA-binding protein Alba [Candidatus Bathyarchaeota archaeon]|nr:DNA-binding protein Alba [Candidatus Bathyarchaeota archaeon]